MKTVKWGQAAWVCLKVTKSDYHLLRSLISTLYLVSLSLWFYTRVFCWSISSNDSHRLTANQTKQLQISIIQTYFLENRVDATLISDLIMQSESNV